LRLEAKDRGQKEIRRQRSEVRGQPPACRAYGPEGGQREVVEGNASVWNSGVLECWADEAESQLDFLLFLLGERMLSSGKYDL
jgi:hypothetical protein